jgi:DNA-3-methyladenine glycosylase
MILKNDFFDRETSIVARELLGKFLVCRQKNKKRAAMITEVEVYDGFRDRASHASRGMTDRNSVMFGPAGYWYVYLVYGMHNMLNIVTREEGYPAAILIRGGVSDYKYFDGPAKFTKFLGINTIYNRKQANLKTGLWLEDRGIAIPKSRIARGRRIGVEYAGREWNQKKLRFFLKNL